MIDLYGSGHNKIIQLALLSKNPVCCFASDNMSQAKKQAGVSDNKAKLMTLL